MTAPDLLPCPFCGGEAELWNAHDSRPAWIACMGRCAVLISKEHTTDAEAIAAWNRRATPTAIREAALREAADLVNRRVDGVRVSIPCPDGKSGCLVHHFRIEDGPTAKAILALLTEGTIRKSKTVADDWECPIGAEGCHKNCGSYGCGN